MATAWHNDKHTSKIESIQSIGFSADLLCKIKFSKLSVMKRIKKLQLLFFYFNRVSTFPATAHAAVT
jgi:hypothetical protein